MQSPLSIAVVIFCLLIASARTQVPGPVPAEYFGLHISNVQNWPALPVSSVRVANVAWGTINPAPRRYDWSLLDRAVETARQHNAEISYLFLKTPQWASARPQEGCYAGPVGCAAPPKSVDDWDAFVRAVVSRYKGKIASYEIWNEPNDRRYWTGSLRELVDMAQRAYRIIKAIDPGARVISPSPTYTKEGPPAQWLDQYLSAGGGESADVIGFHGYVSAKPETVRFVIQGIKTALARHGVKKELWDTEAGWGRNTVVPNEDERAAFVIKSFLIQWSEGVNRFYWYQWDNADWGTLWSGVSGTNKAGRALARARAWMVGAVLNGPCRESDGVWRCSLTRSGRRQEILWSSSAERILPVDNGHKSVESLDGEVAAVKASSLRVSPSPILLRSHE